MPMARIIMIGNTMSGKTSNMVTAYGVLRKVLRENKAFNGLDIHVEENRELEDAYQKYCVNCEGIKATSKIHNHDLRLVVRGIVRRTEIQSYTLGDVVGGFCVADVGTDENYEINARIAQADHILAFFSCEDLLPEDDSKLDKMGKNIDLMLKLINNRIHLADGKRIYLTVVFTKVDKIDGCSWKKEEILDLFDGLLSAHIPGLNVNHYFVCNEPDKIQKAELPILSVLTRLAIDDIRKDSESWYKRIQHSYKMKKRAVIALCRYIRNESGNTWWDTMIGEINGWK